MKNHRKSNGHSVLVAEDDRDISEIYCTKLENNGYGVSACYDGKTAIDMVASYNPDIILLDILLPSVNGMEVLKIIRKFNREIPIIICTNLDNNSTLKKEALSIGANEYLVKADITPGDLVARVNSYF